MLHPLTRCGAFHQSPRHLLPSNQNVVRPLDGGLHAFFLNGIGEGHPREKGEARHLPWPDLRKKEDGGVQIHAPRRVPRLAEPATSSGLTLSEHHRPFDRPGLRQRSKDVGGGGNFLEQVEMTPYPLGREITAYPIDGQRIALECDVGHYLGLPLCLSCPYRFTSLEHELCHDPTHINNIGTVQPVCQARRR